MNQLPAVLQNEIWEYVRGNRAYWKRKLSEIFESDVTKFIFRASQERIRANQRVTFVVDIVPELVALPEVPVQSQRSAILDLLSRQIVDE